MRALAAIALLAAVSIADAASPTAFPAQASALTDKSAEDIALQWFERMRTGQIDRTQLTAQYGAHNQRRQRPYQDTAFFLARLTFQITHATGG